jgi:restriction endonuclease S subunit
MKVEKLQDVCLISKGKTITKATSVEGNVPVIGGGLGPTYYHNIANVKAPVITISASGANAGFVNFWDEPIWASDCSTIIEKPGSPAIIGYIYKFLQGSQEFINSKLRKGSAQPHVYSSDIGQLRIPLPSINEQKQIVEKLDKTFVEIASLEKNLQLKEEKTNQLLQSMLSAAFTNREKFDMKITESTLGDLCEVDWGNTNLTKSSYVPDGKFLAVSASGPDGRIDHYEHEGSIPVLSAIGAQCGKMFFPTEKFTAIKNTITLTPLKDVVDGKYLYYLFTHIELPQRGAGQPFISKGDIQSFKIAIPKEVKDQRLIVNILDDAFAEIDNLRNQFSIEKERVSSLRQSILNHAFKFEEKAS